MGMDLRGSLLLSSGMGGDKTAVLLYFGVKNSNSTEIDLRGL